MGLCKNVGIMAGAPDAPSNTPIASATTPIGTLPGLIGPLTILPMGNGLPTLQDLRELHRGRLVVGLLHVKHAKDRVSLPSSIRVVAIFIWLLGFISAFGYVCFWRPVVLFWKVKRLRFNDKVRFLLYQTVNVIVYKMF